VPPVATRSAARVSRRVAKKGKKRAAAASLRNCARRQAARARPLQDSLIDRSGDHLCRRISEGSARGTKSGPTAVRSHARGTGIACGCAVVYRTAAFLLGRKPRAAIRMASNGSRRQQRNRCQIQKPFHSSKLREGKRGGVIQAGAKIRNRETLHRAGRCANETVDFFPHPSCPRAAKTIRFPQTRSCSAPTC